MEFWMMFPQKYVPKFTWIQNTENNGIAMLMVSIILYDYESIISSDLQKNNITMNFIITHQQCVVGRASALIVVQVDICTVVSGLQLRKSEQNGFHDTFLISQPNPMMWPSLKSSLRDDSNEW